MPALGVLVSSSELLITMVYQFYVFGFGLSSIMLVASIVYLCLNYRDYKIWLSTSVVSTDINHRSTRMLIEAQQEVESNKKVGRWLKVLYVAYILLIILLVFMFGARFCSLCSRGEFRKTQKTYPEACSNWASHGGCSKISIYQDQCVGSGNIPIHYSNTFTSVDPNVLNTEIQNCVDRSLIAKFQYPKKNLDESDSWQPFIHVTWTTSLLGVIDDMFI